jgi:hypothetical protein
LLTVADITDTDGSLGPAIEQWGRAVWAAYADLHATARRWVKQAIDRA